MLSITEQLIDFLQFVLIGVIISIIFDFFRSYRMNKKVSNISVMIQDILFFVIATIIIIMGIVYILDSDLRLFVFLAIILGIFIYVTLLSKIFINIYNMLFRILKDVIEIFILPVNLNLQIIKKIYNFFKKYILKCCKMFFYVISLICRKLNFNKFFNIFNKRGKKNNEKNKDEKKD